MPRNPHPPVVYHNILGMLNIKGCEGFILGGGDVMGCERFKLGGGEKGPSKNPSVLCQADLAATKGQDEAFAATSRCKSELIVPL